MTAIRIVIVSIAVAFMAATLAACAPFDAKVTINETPPPIPTAAPAAAPAPVIVVHPAPVITQSAPATDYTPLILMTTLTMLVIVVAIAIVLTRRQPSEPPTPYAQAAPYVPELPAANITNHYHIYVGIMPGETRGDALARLVRTGMKIEDASSALNAPRAHAELPPSRGK